MIFEEDRTLPAASSKHRTATPPFMAHELVDSRGFVRHLYRHELESFLYIMVWTAVSYEGRKNFKGKKKQLMWWRMGDWLTISKKRKLFFTFWNEYKRIMGEITKKYEVMRYTIRQLIKLTVFFRFRCCNPHGC